MNVYIQLTSAGVDTGPFSLYSDVDAYASPFQTNISRAILLNGFTCTVVPTSTTIIRVQSEDDCTNYIDITIQVNATTTTTTSSTTTSTTSTTTSTTSSTTTTTTTLPPIECIEYGYFYNWFAAVDARNITSSDDWVVPTMSNFDTLRTYLGGSSVAGGKMKEIGTVYWETPNTGATNEVDFNGRGTGTRDADTGIFQGIGSTSTFWSREESDPLRAYTVNLSYNNAAAATGFLEKKKTGHVIRLLYVGVGTPTYYIGNDGKRYRVTTIGTQTWIADNLSETKFRDNSWITGYDDGVYSPISNGAWAAKTTEAMCAFEDNADYVLCPPTTTTTTTAIPIQQLLIARADAGTGEYEAASACGELYNTALVEEETIQVVYFQSASPIPIAGQQLFVDVALTTQFLGSDGTWWASITDWDVVTTNTYDTVVQIAAGSEVLDMVSCAGITTTTTTTTTPPITTTTTTTLSSILYTTRLEEVGVLTYVGDALAGSSESSAVWRIKRIDETSGVVVLWADGNDNFDNVWTDYLTLIYS